jgi:hypothetical protein
MIRDALSGRSGPRITGSWGSGELKMKAKVTEVLNRHPAVGQAMGVVRNGSLEFFHGHGAAVSIRAGRCCRSGVARIGSP